MFVLYLSSGHQTREVFKSTNLDDSNGSLNKQYSQEEEKEVESSNDERLPPIEANINRNKSFKVQSDSRSDKDS
jgi:probable RNA-binding protein EIF1AD